MRIRCIGYFTDSCPGDRCGCGKWHEVGSCQYHLSHWERGGEIEDVHGISNCGCVSEKTGLRLRFLIRIGLYRLQIPYERCRRFRISEGCECSEV